MDFENFLHQGRHVAMFASHIEVDFESWLVEDGPSVPVILTGGQDGVTGFWLWGGLTPAVFLDPAFLLLL